jgi:hypothetical protein
MRSRVRRAGLVTAAAGALMLAHAGGMPARAEEPAAVPSTCAAGAAAMTRVELFFGTARRGRAPVSERRWRHFVATEVVPRFPDGFTEIEARGHWRTDRRPMSEHSHVLVIWLKPDPSVEERIEALRGAYRTRFAQESVLRAESRGCVSF